MSWEEPEYRNRSEAGRVLAARLSDFAGKNVLVLAVPNGGVAVAAPVAGALGGSLHLMVVRKIQFPDNTEAGFGAVGADGTTVMDEVLVRRLGLTPQEVEKQRQAALQSVRARISRYGRRAELPELAGRTVILVDDGLATGSTMEAAVKIVRTQNPAQVIVAAPTCSERARARLGPLVDLLVCPHVGRGPVFAVAGAYAEWYDVSDQEVLSLVSPLGI